MLREMQKQNREGTEDRTKVLPWPETLSCALFLPCLALFSAGQCWTMQRFWSFWFTSTLDFGFVCPLLQADVIDWQGLQVAGAADQGCLTCFPISLSLLP